MKVFSTGNNLYWTNLRFTSFEMENMNDIKNHTTNSI